MGAGARAGRVILAAAVVALASCGLEVLPDLDPPGPTNETTPGSPTFHVNYVFNPTAPPEFRGFEVYYRFYSSDQSMRKDINDTVSNLVDAGFHRMCSPGTAYDQGLPWEPLIPVPPADRVADFTTELVFEMTLPPYFVYGASLPPAYDGLRRIALDGYNEYKTFEQGVLDRDDVDLVDVNWSRVDVDYQLFLLVYAVSYGLLDLSTPLYSKPVYLGYIIYNL